MAMILFMGAFTVSAAFDRDLSISSDDVQVETTVLAGQTVRIYATVHNNSGVDLGGVVKFFDESLGSYIGVDQPVSVLRGATDDVFIDWLAAPLGEHPIAVRVVPWESDGDDPNNNKIVKTVYVDRDSDGDGTPDRLDNDDDNDGAVDSQDAFPFDSKESKDTDGDGVGDNADPDDDNDGIDDIQDLFPQDSKDWQDSDGDGVGDNADSFSFDPTEWNDADGDGLGDNADPDNTNKGPQAVLEISQNRVRAGQLVTLNALKSKDLDGDITTYEWDLGDGTQATGVLIEHAYDKTGLYTVSLKVTDNGGEFRIQKTDIRVVSPFFMWVLVLLLFVLLVVLVRLLSRKRQKADKKPLPKKKK